MISSRMLFSAGLLVAIASLSTASAIVGHPSPTATDQSLTRYMMRRALSNNPEKSVQCFEYFTPVLSFITEEFSKNFQLCTANEKAQIDALNDHAKTNRYQIELAADSVCVRMDACNDHTNALDFFDCYGRQGKTNTRIMYDITQNSTSIGAELREQYRIAEVDRLKCQNASERAYVERTAITYKALDNCLKTGVVPTVPPATTASTKVVSSSSGHVDSTTVVVVDEATTSTPVKEVEVTTTTLSPQPEANMLSRLRKFWFK